MKLFICLYWKSNTFFSDRFCLEIEKSKDSEYIYRIALTFEIFRAPTAISEKSDLFLQQLLYFRKTNKSPIL